MRASHSVWSWTKTAPVMNLKSKFVGLTAVVHSEANLTQQLRDLKQQKDIRKASHVITAWRIQDHHGTTKEGYDDDGEAPGGQRLLELMQKSNVANAALVVVRWYGGTKLGPSRFRIIQKCGRDALVQAGLLAGR